RSPSMSVVVKPHQAVFLAARTDHAAGLVPTIARVPAFLHSILSPPPPSPHSGWGRAAAGKECPSASASRDARDRVAAAQALRVGGARLGPGARPEPPSIRGGPGTVPGTLYRIRLERPARHQSRAHPSNERCLSRFTRRQNGGPLRPRLLPPPRR